MPRQRTKPSSKSAIAGHHCVWQVGKVRAGERRVVRARPAAERNLQHERGSGGDTEQAQAGSRLRESRRSPPAERDQQRERRETAEQVTDDDDRLQQQRHGPHAEQALEDHERDERDGGAPRLARIAAITPRDHGQRDADQAERAREIAMDHLAPRFARLERPRVLAAELLGRRRRMRHDEAPIAARPIGAPEAGIRQPYPGAEHDDGQRQHGTDASQADKPHVHESDPASNRLRSRNSSFCSTSGG